MKIYILGSLRNATIPDLANRLRAEGFDVFDDWHGAGPNADDEWQRYETHRGRTYAEGLRGDFARHVFEFDKRHLDECDVGILVLPAGKSAHMELGYLAGSGKLTFVLFDAEPDRWDAMYQFATCVAFYEDSLISALILARDSLTDS